METKGTAQPQNQPAAASQTSQVNPGDGQTVNADDFSQIAAEATGGENQSAQTQTTETDKPAEITQTLESALDDLGVDTHDIADATKTTEKSPASEAVLNPAQQSTKEPERRNYEGFEPEDVEFLKKLPNHEFNLVQRVARRYADKAASLTAEVTAVKQQFEEVKSGALPSSYYAHPEAYKLSPKYPEIVQQFSQAEQFENHYIQQLENIRGGKPWHRIVSDGNGGYTTVEVAAPVADDENGTVRIDTQADVRVSSLLGQISRTKENAKTALAELRGGFAAKHEQSNARLVDLENKIFTKFVGDNYPQKKQVDEIFASLPVEAGSETFRRMYAKGTVAFGQLALAYQELLKKSTGVATAKAQVRDGGPGPDDFVHGNAKPGAVQMTVDQALADMEN